MTANTALATAASTAPPLVEQRDGAVATLLLNRPARRNCLDYDLALRILAALERCCADPGVRAIVLTGAGTAFCSGDDLAYAQTCLRGDFTGAPIDPDTREHLYLRICAKVLAAPKPVVAGINGLSAGAGTEIACAADYRLAAAGARLGTGLLRVGYVGGVAMLSRVIGPSRATEIYLTSRLVPAAEARQIGLVDRVVPDREFAAELATLAQGLAAAPTAAIGLFKQLRERAMGMAAGEALRLQDEYHHRSAAEVADIAEGVRAFAERRAPRFAGA